MRPPARAPRRPRGPSPARPALPTVGRQLHLPRPAKLAGARRLGRRIIHDGRDAAVAPVAHAEVAPPLCAVHRPPPTLAAVVALDRVLVVRLCFGAGSQVWYMALGDSLKETLMSSDTDPWESVKEYAQSTWPVVFVSLDVS